MDLFNGVGKQFLQLIVFRLYSTAQPAWTVPDSPPSYNQLLSSLSTFIVQYYPFLHFIYVPVSALQLLREIFVCLAAECFTVVTGLSPVFAFCSAARVQWVFYEVDFRNRLRACGWTRRCEWWESCKTGKVAAKWTETHFKVRWSRRGGLQPLINACKFTTTHQVGTPVLRISSSPKQHM